MAETVDMPEIEPPPHARHEADSDGEAFIWQVRPGLIVERATGVLTLPLARCFSEYLDPLLRPGTRWNVFSDLEQLTRYTREAREHLSVFSRDRITCISVIHFLISSKVVALGLSSYRDDIGEARFEIYTERASFLRSFADAVQAPG